MHLHLIKVLALQTVYVRKLILWCDHCETHEALLVVLRRFRSRQCPRLVSGSIIGLGDKVGEHLYRLGISDIMC